MCYYGSCLQCRITGTERAQRQEGHFPCQGNLYLLIPILVLVELLFLIILCWTCKLNYVTICSIAFFAFFFLNVICLNPERRAFQSHGMWQIQPHSNLLGNKKSVWLGVLTATCDAERRKAASVLTVANLSLAQSASAFGQILSKVTFLQ